MRLIDADALLKASRRGKVLYFDDTTTDGYTGVLLAVEVERAPTIDAEPVRHGTWKHVLGMNSKCSECGHYFPVKDFEDRPFDINYCPQCGAKMDGGNA